MFGHIFDILYYSEMISYNKLRIRIVDYSLHGVQPVYDLNSYA